MFFFFFAEDGRVKYKIHFEEKRKSLVSAHHIAFDYIPKGDQLDVGARVVVKHKDDDCHFSPAIMAEAPTRKNRMRFVCEMDNFLRYGLIKLRIKSQSHT